MKKELHTLVLLLALFTTSLAYVKNTEDLHDINILKQHFDDSVGFSQWYNQLSQENKNLVLVGIISGISAYMIQGMTDYPWYNYRVILIFWMVLAFGVSLAKLNQEEK